jgi:predicted transposase YdaD
MQRPIDRTEKPLPLVVPLLFYPGEQSPHSHRNKRRFVDCFEKVKLAEWLYHGALPLVDITRVPEEEILTHRGSVLLEMVQEAHIWS